MIFVCRRFICRVHGKCITQSMWFNVELTLMVRTPYFFISCHLFPFIFHCNTDALAFLHIFLPLCCLTVFFRQFIFHLECHCYLWKEKILQRQWWKGIRTKAWVWVLQDERTTTMMMMNEANRPKKRAFSYLGLFMLIFWKSFYNTYFTQLSYSDFLYFIPAHNTVHCVETHLMNIDIETRIIKKKYIQIVWHFPVDRKWYFVRFMGLFMSLLLFLEDLIDVLFYWCSHVGNSVLTPDAFYYKFLWQKASCFTTIN